MAWGSLAASGGGKASGGKSLGLGFPSACSSPLVMRTLEAMCLALVLVELVHLQMIRVVSDSIKAQEASFHIVCDNGSSDASLELRVRSCLL